jgi:fluoride exporter
MPGDHPEDVGRPGPDSDPEPARAPGPLAGQGPAFGAVAVGGALGALARYALALALPPVPGQFPLATFLTNVAGGLLIGVLVVLLTEVTTAHPLARPFLVTGILGGFTTFSTYAVDLEHLLARHAVGLALGYLFGTLAAALLATWGGMAATRALAGGAR